MTPIITAATVKSTTGISRNVEDRKLDPFIYAAQLTLKKVTGKTGYDAIVAAFPAFTGAATLETLYNDYIVNFLSWKVIELAGTRMFTEPDRNGTLTRSDNTYQSVDGKTLAMGKADSRDMAGIYMQELIDYLADNTDVYTWYDDSSCSDGITKSNTGGVITRLDRFQRPYGERWYNQYDPDGY